MEILIFLYNNCEYPNACGESGIVSALITINVLSEQRNVEQSNCKFVTLHKQSTEGQFEGTLIATGLHHSSPVTPHPRIRHGNGFNYDC